MYTATPSSKHGQYMSHICDRRWPPVHTQHTTTNNNDNDKFDDHNNEEQQEQYHKYHNHHNHHQQLDKTHVVWAIWWVFFFSLCFFILLNNIYSNYDYIIATEGHREGGDEENGPLVCLFLFSSCFLLLINNIYSSYDYIKLQRDSGKEVVRRTGPNDTYRVVWAIQWVFFKISIVFYIYTNYYWQQRMLWL